jgi:antitoxin MazE
VRGAVRKMGNSSGVIIPKPLLVEIGAKAGDDVDIQAEDGRIVIVPIERHPRAGWALDAAEIAAVGDDKLVWPEFGNADDEAIEW